MKKLLAIIAVFSISGYNHDSGQGYQNATISDNKEVINKTTYQVEVCTNQTVRNDTTGDMIVGGIIGGIIGNQIGKGGGKMLTGIGALTGAIIANIRMQVQKLEEYVISKLDITKVLLQYTLILSSRLHITVDSIS